ncbi:hypothetical protein A3F00_05060 [Candidatus Daviesbacteria bacterium RIFCSPHIGHO2_12_FULL_37_11]|uniref:Prepilin peptidase n=1 Tax=Candidatus Daviesbacteria bacterium RIFCSPHIGHO2_12_FULL_37_11 TaxID=1797777 RepID=A0A1F5K9N5_9BACT|nr:MAG: hypothetical protein A3F00_05060 [Candidatus Daviesbacteria bacterium RIFCSPHIGHO2_12_FULL_37_11]
MIIFGFILGIVLGSFTKALADRSLKGKSFFGRSYCPDCKHTLSWYDLPPLVSFILLKGKCRYCRRKISPEYILVELVMGILIAFLFYQSSPVVIASPAIGGTWQSLFFNYELVKLIFDLIFKTFFITVLVSVTLTDFKRTLIPDRIIIPGIWIAIASLAAFTIYRVGYLYWYLNQSSIGKLLLPPASDYFTRHSFYALQDLLLGGVLTGAGIAGFFLSLIIITKGRGMGGGDVKLGAFMGLGLGFPGGILATVLAFLTGAVSAVFLIIIKKKKFGENIPFGPFLVLGSLITLFWGQEIIKWYLQLSS